MRVWMIGLVGLVLGSTAFAEDPEKKDPPSDAPPADAPPADIAEPAAAPVAAPAVDGALRKDLEALAAQVAAQQAQIEAQEAALAAQQDELTKTKLKLIPKDEYTVELEGYYRVRGHVFNGLYPPIRNEGLNKRSTRDTRFMDHRLKIRPTFNYKDLAKLKLQVNGLDNVVWGDNASISSTALFAADPSYTGPDGAEVPSFELERAWMEFSVPVGLLRFGRQPSHWGMGLLANDGDWHPGDKWSPLPSTSRNVFGESYAGNTFDRAIFATKPLAVVSAITGGGGGDIPLIFGVGIDRLVEDPLIQFYGYECPDIGTTGEGYDSRCDTDADGATDIERDYTDDTLTADQRPLSWWADQQDDVWEMIYVLLYKGEDLHYLGGTGDFTAGTYVVARKQQETKSDVLIVDGYLRANVHDILVEAEGVTIAGDTRALVLPGGPVNAKDPLKKTANIAGYAARAGYAPGDFKFVVEYGYASGDDNVADARFTGRSLHSDHNVGLLLYEEVLSRVTAVRLTEAAEGLWSRGGVYNSRYVFPTVHYFPLDNWELIGGFVTARPDKADGAVIACGSEDKDCRDPVESDSLGWEVDFGVHHQWHKHLLFAMEGAYAETSDRINTASAGLNPEGKFFTFQSRIAWQF